MRALAILRLATIVLVLPLTACSADPVGSEDCVAAFRDVEPRAAPPYDTSTLDDAIHRCESFAEWRTAWEAVPGAHPEGADLRGFLVERCADARLSPTALCREVVGQGHGSSGDLDLTVGPYS